MARPKGKPKSGGRKKGTPNRITRAFREAVLAVFDGMGGETHLLQWAKENPTEFYRITARMAPPGTPVNLGRLHGQIADQGKAVLAKMFEGSITPEQSSTIMQAFAAQARIIEVDELERRVKTLEDKQNAKP